LRDGHKSRGWFKVAKVLIPKVGAEAIGNPNQIQVGVIGLTVPLRKLKAEIGVFVGDWFAPVGRAETGVVCAGAFTGVNGVVVGTIVFIDLKAVLDVGVDIGGCRQCVVVSLASATVPARWKPNG